MTAVLRGPADPAGLAEYTAVVLDADNPWPGLNSFREEDQNFFRGRTAEAEALLRHVNRERVTVLFGVSGLGKSSIVRAGLFPPLRLQNFLPVDVRLAYGESAVPLREQVLRAIADEAALRGVECPAHDPAASLWEHFHRQGLAYWGADNKPATPLISFDQFEEAFTIGRATPGQTKKTRAFLDELGDLIEGRPSGELKAQLDANARDPKSFVFNRHPYKVLLSIREDFLAELESLREKIPSLGTNRMRLTPLTGEAALLVTGVAGSELVPPDVGEKIVRFVAGERTGSRSPLEELGVDPALLSLFCSELNERRKQLGRDSIGADLLQGSQDEILSSYYERSFSGLPAGARRFVEEELITDSGYRDSTALEGALRFPGVSRAVIDMLIARRLIRLEESLGTSRVELTHDVLTRVVQTSRDRRRLEEEQEREAQRIREEHEREAHRARVRRKRMVWVASATGVLVAAGIFVWIKAAAEQDEADRAVARADSAIVRAARDSLAATAATARAEAATLEAESATQRAGEQEQQAQLASTQARTASAAATAFQREALVGREIADDYVDVARRIVGRSTAADSAHQAAISAVLGQADSVATKADSIAVQRVVNDVLAVACGMESKQRLDLFALVLRVTGRTREQPCPKTPEQRAP